MSASPNNDEGNVRLLADMTALDLATASHLLKKHNGDVQKAIEAFLTGDHGESSVHSDVIDLTENKEPTFGPSNRDPDPSWAMTTVSPTSDLDKAIQASLHDLKTAEPEEAPFSLDLSTREDGRPVVLYEEKQNYAYASLAVQALFHVPQVRESVAEIPLANLGDSKDDVMIRQLLEIFTNLDLAKLSLLYDTTMLPMWSVDAWDDPSVQPGGLTAIFIKSISEALERQVDQYRKRLFSFSVAKVTISNDFGRMRYIPIAEDSTGTVVTVDVKHDPASSNDLISQLSETLVHDEDRATTYDLISESSELVCFHLKREHTSGSRRSVVFKYPDHLFLDRFLEQNVSTIHQLRASERKILSDIEHLLARKKALTSYNNSDNLKGLEVSIYYYEHLAVARRNKADSTKITHKLKAIQRRIKEEVESIDKQVFELKTHVQSLYDSSDLRKHRYDLRAVLFYTGVYGRNGVYSYVQDNGGLWWKTIDRTVIQVSETAVLTDASGLHLGAGPYMLFYSRSVAPDALQKPIAWPASLRDAAENHNKTYLELTASAQPSRISNPDSLTPNTIETVD